jgi:hypothetical protein
MDALEAPLPPIIISPADLPDGTKNAILFEDSSFFKQQVSARAASLPSRGEVRARATGPSTSTRPAPIIFESLSLLVKYGSCLTTSEAQCLWVVGKYLKGRVPVPEIYGWRRDGKELFIYMELIRGHTLEQRWDNLTDPKRVNVCSQLRLIVQCFRQFEQDPSKPFIGKSGNPDKTRQLKH